jgi:hypothetical protein
MKLPAWVSFDDYMFIKSELVTGYRTTLKVLSIEMDPAQIRLIRYVIIKEIGSVADPGCLSRILIFTHPGSWIQKQYQKREIEKKICYHTFFGVTNFSKLNIMLFLKWYRKKFGPIFKELLKFLPKKFSICSQIYGFGIRDPRCT